jgi:glycerol-3-phosphate acyltransferase PlsY
LVSVLKTCVLIKQWMIVQSVLLIVAGYLLGSVSATYLVGRWLGGRDLREYGSGTLGGSMVYEHVGRWAVVPVILWDVGKAALPTWLGLWLGLGETVAAAAGLAAAVGHNWSIFLRFAGGRGMGTFAGMWLILFPPGVLWMTVLLGIGWRLGDSAPWLLVSLLAMPLLAYLLGGPRALGPVLLGGPAMVASIAAMMILITLAKRLEGNRRPLPHPGPERTKVILRRLFLDRDIASHEEWIRREPHREGEGPETMWRDASGDK